MYELFVKPLKYPGYIYIGVVYLTDIGDILDSIKDYIENAPIDSLYQETISQRYSDSRYLRVSVRDSYDNDKEIYSAIYDVEDKNFFKEV